MAEFIPPIPVTCAGCGLLCDDVTVQRSDDALQLRPPCRLGAAWFSERTRRPVSVPAATIRGQAADVGSALARAADLLREARRPLLYGFEGATVEDARAAVSLADRLGALIATDGVSGPWPGAPAVALRGASTATLGEIRDRSGVVVIWREDPESTHPRLLERLGCVNGASWPPGANRVLVVIDDRDTATARRSDLQLRWGPERDLEALIILRVLHRGLTVQTGELEAQLRGLLDRIQAVPHVAFVHGAGLTTGTGGQRRALALHELVRALSHERHVVTMALPTGAGLTGTQDALAWQTGYFGTVDLASGHPELVSATRPLAEAEGVDVFLRIEGLPARRPVGVAEISLCALPAGPDVEVSIRTAAAGVEARGTMHRLDGVPLTLQAPRTEDALAEDAPAEDAPTAAALLTRLAAEVQR